MKNKMILSPHALKTLPLQSLSYQPNSGSQGVTHVLHILVLCLCSSAVHLQADLLQDALFST